MTKAEREYVKTLTKSDRDAIADVRKFVHAVANGKRKGNNLELRVRFLALAELLGVDESFVARLMSR